MASQPRHAPCSVLPVACCLFMRGAFLEQTAQRDCRRASVSQVAFAGRVAIPNVHTCHHLRTQQQQRSSPTFEPELSCRFARVLAGPPVALVMSTRRPCFSVTGLLSFVLAFCMRRSENDLFRIFANALSMAVQLQQIALLPDALVLPDERLVLRISGQPALTTAGKRQLEVPLTAPQQQQQHQVTKQSDHSYDPIDRLYLAASCWYPRSLWLRVDQAQRSASDTRDPLHPHSLAHGRPGCRSPLCSLSRRLRRGLRLRLLRRRKRSCWTCTSACRCRPRCGATSTARSSRSSSTSSSMAYVHVLSLGTVRALCLFSCGVCACICVC